MTIKELINKANKTLDENNIEECYLKTRILLSKLLNQSKEYLVIYQDKEVESEIEEKFWFQINKLKNNIPIQYIINEQEFMGINFFVDENVLIPQPDTEVLVEEVLLKIKCNDKILDLCTGSGAIGISIAKKANNVSVDLLDISEKALEVAKKNAQKNNVNVNIIHSNLFNEVKSKYNIIVSNPPYIESQVIKNLSLEVQKEPVIALDGGEDGLDFYRIIANKASNFLEKDGILALEIGYNQKIAVKKILEKYGYKNIYSKKDYGNNDRIILAMRGE